VPTGWINDPHGVCWHDGRYELFFQYNPDAPTWAVACRWGRTTSPDLVRWGPVDVALAPQEGEAGCWTGSVVVDDSGRPVIVYTSVRAEHLDLGTVVLAVGDRAWRTFEADPSAPVLTGPPPGSALRIFRDPHVEREGDGWRMVVGGGTQDGRALALLYRSTDLRTWRYKGVLAERPGTETHPVWAGSAWECVQFFPLDGRWVLLLSAWHDDVTLRVLAAVGDFDGHRFIPAAWQRFGSTDVLYATTTFLDSVGRRCAMSWAREQGPVTTGYAGALSLPWVLGVRGDRLVQTPHPDVATLRAGIAAALDGPGEAGPFLPFLDIEVRLDPAEGPARIELRGPGGVAALAVDLDPGRPVLLTPAGKEPVALESTPAVAPDTPEFRLLVDAGLIEVATAAGDASALRLGCTGPVTVAVVAGTPRVTVHPMPRGVD
jgi:beta-fructofuranosidase